MNLPFSPSQFFQVFATYNQSVWPAQYVLLLLAVATVVLVLRAPNRAGVFAAATLTILWAWMGVAYHLAFFWSINPVAPAFAVIALAASAAFVWQGWVKRGLQFEAGWPPQKTIGLAFIAFALVGYPLAGEMLGHRYPAVPTFGLPCPTTIFTLGVLLMATPAPSRLQVIAPLLWALIGTTAAFALGVVQDLALIAAAVAGLWLLVRRRPASGNP
ncbi:MAG: DUF6064 family protein [Gammaproteobacteria bacterium]